MLAIPEDRYRPLLEEIPPPGRLASRASRRVSRVCSGSRPPPVLRQLLQAHSLLHHRPWSHRHPGRASVLHLSCHQLPRPGRARSHRLPDPRAAGLLTGVDGLGTARSAPDQAPPCSPPASGGDPHLLIARPELSWDLEPTQASPAPAGLRELSTRGGHSGDPLGHPGPVMLAFYSSMEAGWEGDHPRTRYRRPVARPGPTTPTW